MKKFYSILVVALMSLVSIVSQAKEITFQTTDACSGTVSVVDVNNNIDITLSSTPVKVTCPDTPAPVIAKATEGHIIGHILSIQANGTIGFQTDRTQYNENEYTMNWAMFSDGSIVTIGTFEGSVSDKKAVTFVGEPNTYYVMSSDYRQFDPDNTGKTATIDYAQISSFTVYARDGYRIKSIKDENGYPYGETPAEYASIKTRDFAAPELTLNVTTENLADVLGSRFTVKIHDGQPYQVQMYYGTNRKSVNISSIEQEIPFAAGTEFCVCKQYAYSAFYKVTLNDSPIEKNSNNYYNFIPADGDVLDIYVEFPAIEVPFSVSFADGTDDSIITGANYSGDYNLSKKDILADGFKALLGKKVQFYIDNQSYEDIVMTVNGVDKNIVDNSAEVEITEESGYEIVFSGKRTQPYHLTIVVRDPESLKVFMGSYQEPIELTGQITEVDVERSKSYITFKAADGYRINNLTIPSDESFNFYSYTSSYYLKGDTEMDFETEAIERNHQAIVYLEDISDKEDTNGNAMAWNYLSFTLSNSDYALRTNVTLTPGGYAKFNYGDFDLPLYISTYPYAVVYLNDEKIEGSYGASGGTFEATNDMPEGSVFKLYHEEKSKHSVTYTIADNINVKVTHDHITEIANPSNHSVLPGTRIHIAPEAGVVSRAAADIAVTVNGSPVVADEDGVYAIDVNADTDIAVKAAGDSGIDAVINDPNAPDAVYNLQGIRVNDNNLPAGVYIKGGRKIYVK